METVREVTGVTAIPAGVIATGTLSQDAQVPTVLVGAGTDLYTELGNKANPYLFFPNTAPPQLLQIVGFAAKNDPVLPQAADWIKVKVAPGVAIAAQAFQIVSATLRAFSVLNKGGADATNGFDGTVDIIDGETISFPIAYYSGSGPIQPKAAHWVDGSGTTLQIDESL